MGWYLVFRVEEQRVSIWCLMFGVRCLVFGVDVEEQQATSGASFRTTAFLY